MSSEKKQPNNKRALCTAIVVLLIIFGMFFVSDTYARYIVIDSAADTAGVAKWAVVMKDGDQPLAQSFRIDFTAKSNPYVAPGKFAPSSEMEATVVLDLTGTEVAVGCTITADMRVFGAKTQSGDIALTVYDNGKHIVSGQEIRIGIADAREHTFRFVLSWETDGDSATDVDFALHNAAVSLPVSIRVCQRTENADATKGEKRRNDGLQANYIAECEVSP